MNNPVHADAISNIHATLAGSEDIFNARAVMLGRNNAWNCVQRTRNEKAPLLGQVDRELHPVQQAHFRREVTSSETGR
ncbi:hypothetical protein PPGU19_070590 (plasmid) [Paraburkholderia sp. PGU19]|uniref:hypothetical protein n=1 Tax=Paraburkholderia sp. PGU19 TaxID=2735434 RepID=UPI0015DBBD6C|nr:hypothetical protein [Paraburkholderia sp. PGU19]BCG02491.1 hypothetical protein PPGU19_070590 [Paraburkholderia sp. PGU19]